MKIICDRNLPYAKEAFSTLGDVSIMDGRLIQPKDLTDTELLIIRSTCKVNRTLLEKSAVRFIGCGIIGTDHLDIPYLKERGTPWVSAPGCNAESVATYVTAALLLLGRPLEGLTLGVVGAGNVGIRVARKGRALGLRVLANDPPRQNNSSDEEAQSFVGYDTILAESDIITYHVPMVMDGAWPTWHLLDGAAIARMKPGVVLFNAARGAVADTDALINARRSGKVSALVVDCWEGEPLVRTDLLPHTLLATPHIAGHSFEGKVNGTRQVYQAACQFLGVKPSYDFHLPPPPVPEIALNAKGQTDEAVLRDLVHAVYPILSDDARFRAGCVGDAASRRRAFDFMRGHYPESRRQFETTRVMLSNASDSLCRKVAGLGFELV